MIHYHWWKSVCCDIIVPRKDKEPPKKCGRCLKDSSYDYLGYKTVKEEKFLPQESKPDSTNVVVIVEHNRVKNVDLDLKVPGIVVEVYDYDINKYDKDVIESDEYGRLCKRTNYVSRGGSEVSFLFKVRVENNDVKKVSMPSGCECLVKTYPKGERNPIVKRWVIRK
jgi:hypothetical protein